MSKATAGLSLLPAEGSEKPKRKTILGRIGNVFSGMFGASEEEEEPNFDISTPYNFQHVQHVKADPRSSTGFSGLPDKFAMVLKASGISKDDTARNPQAVIDVLNFHFDGPQVTMPANRKSMARRTKDAIHLKEEDYKARYGSLKKLGSGASGVVYSAKEKKTGRHVRVCTCKTAPFSSFAHAHNTNPPPLFVSLSLFLFLSLSGARTHSHTLTGRPEDR